MDANERLARYFMNLLATDAGRERFNDGSMATFGDANGFIDHVLMVDDIKGEIFLPRSAEDDGRHKGGGEGWSGSPRAVESSADRFRDRLPNETWAEYGAAHQAWRRSR